MKHIVIISISIFLLGYSAFICNPVIAHPGRTASDGCHYCRTNCDYWGVPWNQRHCHGGYTTPAPNEKSLIAPEEISEKNTEYKTDEYLHNLEDNPRYQPMNIDFQKTY